MRFFTRSGGSGEAAPRCSFCNKPREGAQQLISGPKVFICAGCVEICVSILEEDRRVKQAPAGTPAGRSCALCSRMVEPCDCLIVHQRPLCPNCLALIADHFGSQVEDPADDPAD